MYVSLIRFYTSNITHLTSCYSYHRFCIFIKFVPIDSGICAGITKYCVICGHQQQPSLSPKFWSSAMQSQQNSPGRPHVFFYAILFYLTSYTVIFSINMSFFYLFFVFLYFFPFPQLESTQSVSLIH